MLEGVVMYGMLVFIKVKASFQQLAKMMLSLFMETNMP